MTDRIHLDHMTSNQLDQLYGRAERAEALLAECVTLAEVTHRYRIQGGHDSLGAGLSCAGCALVARMKEHLSNQKETAR